jgi:pyruvate/2-oxoglutarate/acetoin dehydrogenase E1 component
MAAYGYMAKLARQAALRLAYENETFIELVVPTQLSPFEIEPVIASARRTGRLLIVEEGTYSLGWGAEIVARVAESLGSRLQAVHRLAAHDLPIPASAPLEQLVLPGIDDIIQAANKMV